MIFRKEQLLDALQNVKTISRDIGKVEIVLQQKTKYTEKPFSLFFFLLNLLPNLSIQMSTNIILWDP